MRDIARKQTPNRSKVCRFRGRKLTDFDSIRRGIGPECWEQIQEKQRRAAPTLFDDEK